MSAQGQRKASSPTDSQAALESKPLQLKQQTQTASETDKQRQENRTGLPNALKAGIEKLSGHSLSDVRVHYNSSEPAKVGALAYTQGTEIHVGPDQERHLPHEAWHVVQQAQERVKPTLQAKERRINDDRGLEKEADIMGERAMCSGSEAIHRKETGHQNSAKEHGNDTDQKKLIQMVTNGTLQSTVIQMAREWTGLDAEKYQEQNGRFSKFDVGSSSWVSATLPEQEIVSQYFGGMVRTEAPPLSIAEYVGTHTTPVDQSILDTKPDHRQGIVGAWDTKKVGTGHARSGEKGKMNQLGDGIYVVPANSRSASAKDWQAYDKPSIVYKVYAMKGISFDTAGDNYQKVFKNPEQFRFLCFVKDSILASKKEEHERQQQNSRDEDARKKGLYDAKELAQAQADKKKGHFSLF